MLLFLINGEYIRYTTAYARKQLQDAIKLCGEQIAYCDTDSVKTVGPVNINILNDRLKKTAERMGAFADDMNCKRHYIGLFEDDGHYNQFITQGAKRYAYIVGSCKYEKTCPNGSYCHMGITTAGVSKKINEETGYSFAVEELGSLENFRVGMTWHNAGGTIAVYKDHDDFDYTDPESGKTIHISKNVSIVEGTYEMKYAKDYKLLLGEIELYGEYQRKRE